MFVFSILGHLSSLLINADSRCHIFKPTRRYQEWPTLPNHCVLHNAEDRTDNAPLEVSLRWVCDSSMQTTQEEEILPHILYILHECFADMKCFSDMRRL